jgi:hypothetical protein
MTLCGFVVCLLEGWDTHTHTHTHTHTQPVPHLCTQALTVSPSSIQIIVISVFLQHSRIYVFIPLLNSAMKHKSTLLNVIF